MNRQRCKHCDKYKEEHTQSHIDERVFWCYLRQLHDDKFDQYEPFTNLDILEKMYAERNTL